MSQLTVGQRLLILFVLWFVFFGGKGVVAITTKATAVTYVYEKGMNGVPNYVQAAINKLNHQGFTASNHEVDVTDGEEQVPDQFKVAVAAAKEAGLPSVVSTAGDKVVKVVKEPKTEDEVLGVVK